MTIQEARVELAELISAETPATGYSSVPGAADMPAVIVGLPRRYVPVYTNGLRLVELPLYVVTTSADPESMEEELLELLELLCPLLAGLKGSTFLSCRIPDVDQFYDVTVGTTSAISGTANAELILR